MEEEEKAEEEEEVEEEAAAIVLRQSQTIVPVNLGVFKKLIYSRLFSPNRNPKQLTMSFSFLLFSPYNNS